MVKLSCGSKVFLFGEYLALEGGLTLLASLEPRFELTLELVEKSEAKSTGFSSSGPVADFLTQHQDTFRSYSLNFSDPHQGRGGYGASTAQLLLLMAAREHLPIQPSQSQPQFDLHSLLNEYRNLHDEKARPSGADFMAQARGGLLAFQRDVGRLDNYIWPFPEMQIFIFSTKQKLATHEHLVNLGPINTENLKRIAEVGIQSLREMRAEGFASAINDYHEELERMQLVSPHTHDLLRQVRQIPGVLAAKGCGAMGFDSFLVLAKSGSGESLKSFGPALVLPQDLTQGLNVTGSV